MPTSDLNTISNGDLQIQSGNGIPDHSASGGTMYIEIGSGITYLNKVYYSGNSISNKFEIVPVNPSACIYASATTLNIVTGTANTWLPITGSTYVWTVDNLNGFSHSNGILKLTANTPGSYFVNMAYTIRYVSTLSTYEAGVGKNGVVPQFGMYGTNTINVVAATKNTINAFGYINLVSGDTLQVNFRCPLAATTTTRFDSAFLSIRKMQN